MNTDIKEFILFMTILVLTWIHGYCGGYENAKKLYEITPPSKCFYYGGK